MIADYLIDNVVSGIQNASQMVQEIAEASSAQSNNTKEVQESISQLDAITQQNSAASEQSASASEQLASQAKALQEMIQFYKINANENMDKTRSSFYKATVQTTALLDSPDFEDNTFE